MLYDIRKFSCKNVELAPSLLAADFGMLDQEVERMSSAGISILHLDIMDGHFVPNISYGAPVIEALRPKHKMLFDAHLMISHPAKYAQNFADAGADNITFHAEIADDIAETIEAIRATNATVGISITPNTPASVLIPYLDKIELILVMTVEAGFGGQSFRHEVVPKIAEVRAMIDNSNYNIKLEVDGGVNGQTASIVRDAGAEILVAGTALFRADDLNTAIQKLTN